MESLEKQLICPICLEIFSKPVVILPCQHNLCRKCANDIFQASNPYLSSRSGSVASGGRFRCPSCRHEVVLDRHGVYGLQRNLLVENIIDMYKQGSTSSKVAPEPSRVEPMCEEHQEEKINIYCVTCGVPTCSLCKVFGTHQSCQVAPLDTVFQQHKAELTDCITMLVGNNERLEAIISNLEETCHTVEENGRRQKSRLCEMFDQLFGLLEEKKTDMTVQINSEQEEKLDYIRGLKRRYTEHLENMAKVLETGINTMDESEMAVFLQTAKPLLQKLIEGTNTSHLEKVEQGYENMDHFTANFERQGRALLTVDFIKIEEEEEEEELHVTTSQPSPTATQPSPSAVQLPLPPTQQSASSFQQTPFTSQLVPPTSQLSSSTTQPTPPATLVAAGTSQLASTATQLASTASQLASTSTQLASTATQLAPTATKLVSTTTQPDAAKGQLTPTASQLAPSTKSAGPGSSSQTQNQALQAGGSSAQSETGQTDKLEDKDGPRHVFSFSWLNQK